jgi:hypothetical protein
MKKPKYISRKIKFYQKKEFWTIIVGIFFIMLMALSAVDVGQNHDNDDSDAVEYKGIDFELTHAGWQGSLDGEVISLTYSPDYVEDTLLQPVDVSFLESNTKVYLSINPEEAVQSALADFQANIDLPLAVTSCYVDSDACSSLAIKTCEDATDTVGVVIFKEADIDRVTVTNNCLTVEGKDLLKVTDKLILDQYV